MPGAGALLAAVQVLVTVLDGDSGVPVSGLTAGSFAASAQVESVSVPELPVAVLLAVDASVVGGVVKAVAQDLARQLRPGDRLAVSRIQFSGDPHLLDGLATALAPPFPDKSFRHILVLVTAGIEEPNRAQESEIVQQAREKGIAVYPVYLHGSGRWLYPGLAARTGGAAFWLRERHTATGIFSAIRSPYLLTMSSPVTAIKVKGREKTFVSALPYLPA